VHAGGGKRVTAQVFLVMMARANPVISILKRGNSYRSLVELMGAGSLKWTSKVHLVSRTQLSGVTDFHRLSRVIDVYRRK
jgi:hypothetical protein